MWTRNLLSTIVLAGIFSVSLLPLGNGRASDIPAMADLRADVQGDPEELLLRWSTPFFDVPEEGTKTEPSYDIRFGSSPLTESSWDASSPVAGSPPGVVLYSHAVLTLQVSAYTRSDGYIYWDRVQCHAELYYQIFPGLATPIKNEPIYFEVRKQSNGQLAALGGPVYTDNAGWADWHSDDLTDVSRANGGESRLAPAAAFLWAAASSRHATAWQRRRPSMPKTTRGILLRPRTGGPSGEASTSTTWRVSASPSPFRQAPSEWSRPNPTFRWLTMFRPSVRRSARPSVRRSARSRAPCSRTK